MSSPGSVRSDERLRLFLALRLPPDVLDAVAAWQARELGDGGRAGSRRIVPRKDLHVTLAFLGSRPAHDLREIVAALDAATTGAPPIALEIERYRETRSVGMLVLREPAGAAADLANDLHERLEALGLYGRESRPWLPHITVVRFRNQRRSQPVPTRLGRPLLGAFAPSDAAVFLSRLHPSGARYEVLETRSLQRRK